MNHRVFNRTVRLPSLLLLSLSALFLFGCEEEEGTEVAQGGTTEEVATEGGAIAVGEPGGGTSETGRGPNIERTSEPGKMTDRFPLYGNVDRIERTMASIAGARKMEGGSESAMEWRGGRFLEYPVMSWAFGFYKDQMTYTQLQFSSDQLAQSLEDSYEALSREMNERYGAPVFDSDKQISRQLDRYSDEEIAFIEKVGLSLKGGRFRFWTPTDSTADMLTTLHMIPQDPTLTTGYIHLAWYDRIQAVADLRASGIIK